MWWVWASQVAYNVRFRQSDWLHRLFVFLQLLVFCALAAFTNNFDITNGIVNDNKEQQLLQKVQLMDFSTMNEIAVANWRANRLPAMNARGISMTMAFSRLLLLVQYTLGSSYNGDVHPSDADNIFSNVLCNKKGPCEWQAPNCAQICLLDPYRNARFLLTLLFHRVRCPRQESFRR